MLNLRTSHDQPGNGYISAYMIIYFIFCCLNGAIFCVLLTIDPTYHHQLHSVMRTYSLSGTICGVVFVLAVACWRRTFDTWLGIIYSLSYIFWLAISIYSAFVCITTLMVQFEIIGALSGVFTLLNTIIGFISLFLLEQAFIVTSSKFVAPSYVIDEPY